MAYVSITSQTLYDVRCSLCITVQHLGVSSRFWAREAVKDHNASEEHKAAVKAKRRVGAGE